MLKTNTERLVKISVTGEVASPVFASTYRVSAEGRPQVLPGVGGISYNVKVGDLVTGFEADHVEPGVSIKNRDKYEGIPDAGNRALNILSCVGNAVRVSTGDAKGAEGTVMGMHGGIEHVLVHFSDDTLEKLNIGDKMLIKAHGQGLQLLDYPEVKAMNCDPGFLHKIGISEDKKTGKLEIPVTHLIPGCIMGSGLGADNVYSGDYDIQMFDAETVEKYNLGDLRFGDLVALLDVDNSFGRIFKTGAITVGIVVHSNCIVSGHGPGVTTLFTSRTGKIWPLVDKKANLKQILKLKN